MKYECRENRKTADDGIYLSILKGQSNDFLFLFSHQKTLPGGGQKLKSSFEYGFEFVEFIELEDWKLIHICWEIQLPKFKRTIDIKTIHGTIHALRLF